MLQAFVGTASNQGLAVLHPERDETISLVERSVRTGANRIGFWAVLEDTEARSVQALFAGGRRREAMLFLDRVARHMGRILPNGAGESQRYGAQAAFVSAGGYHHIGLNTRESRCGSPPPAGTTGLYHTAILYPTRKSLAVALRRVLEAGMSLDGASDHGVSEALYLRDPDDNGVELYRDRPPDLWPRTPGGELAMFTRRLDLNSLLKEIESGEPVAKVGEGPRDL